METLQEAELCFPELFNASCKKRTRPQSEAVLTYLLLSCFSLITASLNLLVIVSISHFRQLHTPTNLLLLSLAVCDFLIGLFVIPLQILLIEPCWFLGDVLCVLHYFIPFITVYSSEINMVLISVDRYVAICDPLRYCTKVTENRVKLCVVLSWAFCVLYSFIILYDNLKQPGRFNSCYGQCVININGTVHLVFAFILPISSIIILYSRVFVVAVSQARSIRSHVAAAKLQRSLTVTVQRSELKAARTLGVVIVAFLMCYCPIYCISLSGSTLMIGSSANTIALLLYCNSCLNPVIYVFFYSWFRKSIKLIVTLQILQPNSYKANIL